MKQHNITKRKKTWLIAALVLSLASAGALLLYFLPLGVDLEAVLLGKGAADIKGGALFFALISFTAAVLSAVKHYDIGSREEGEYKAEIGVKLSHLSIEHEKVKAENSLLISKAEALEAEKIKLLHELSKLHRGIMERFHRERMLGKEMSALNKEAGALIAQKEALILSLNAKEIEMQKLKAAAEKAPKVKKVVVKEWIKPKKRVKNGRKK